MKIPVYGKADRKPNVYHEVREAVLYKKEARLREFAKSDPDTVMLVAMEGPSIDPSTIATICPELLPRIAEFVAKAAQDGQSPSDRQVPEIVLRLAEMLGPDAGMLQEAFYASCAAYSNRAVLEGLELFGIPGAESFIIERVISKNNCKGLMDLATYYPDFNRDLWVDVFIKHEDINGAVDMIGRGLFEVTMVDDKAYLIVEAASVDPESAEFKQALKILFELAELLEDKLNLSRIEDLLIKVDVDSYMNAFADMFKMRNAIPDYLLMKKILNS